ncbi:MAG: NAD-dependent epimerase/dehydratase family protein [Candidatus Hydrogenedentota bacterium]|nr:MAG: NAD-dependent epimerase/dehydratase family protein [Candidatus Hydrogenedentota bacterium]
MLFFVFPTLVLAPLCQTFWCTRDGNDFRWLMKLKDKRVFITGIGGFIGSNLCKRALQEGAEVLGIELNPFQAKEILAEGAEVMIGDFTNEDALTQGLSQNIDLVFHTAAVVEEGGDLERFREINVRGTEKVASIAAKNNVKGFVHFSSVMVYGFHYPDMADETSPLRGENNPYCQTKIESEEVLQQVSRNENLPTLIIRPGDVYGIGSKPWVIRPLQMMRDRLFFLPDGGEGIMNHVYIDNLIDAVFLAIEKDKWGEVYNVTDLKATTFKEYFSWLAHIADLPEPATLPSPILKAMIFALEKGARLFGQKPIATVDAIHFLERKYPYSAQKAVKELGYSPKINLETGMGRIRNAIKQGLLRF